MTPELDAPPIVSIATDQHAQNMWVLGVMKGRLDSIDDKIESLVEESKIRSGRMEKAEQRLTVIENRQAESKGKSEAFRLSWSIVSIIITIILSGVGLILHYFH